MNRPQLQRDIFPRGNPESIAEIKHPEIHRDPVRPAHRLCRAAPAAGAGDGASGKTHGVVAERGARIAGASGRHGRGLEPPRRIPAQLRRRSLAKGDRVCIQLCCRAWNWCREGEVELHQKEAFAPLVFSKASAAASVRRDDRAGSAGRVSGRRRPSHGKPGGKTRSRCRGALRSIRRRGPRNCGCWKRCCSPPTEPLDQAALAKRMPDGVDIKAALAQLQADYASRGVNLVRVANKWTFRTAGDLSWLMTRRAPRRGGCRARRSRCWRSSPITSR